MKHLLSFLFICIIFLSCKKDNSSGVFQNTDPVINSFMPLSGGYNTMVTIRGKNFGTAAADKVISINGNVATIQNWNDTIIMISVPEKAGTGSLEVTIRNKKVIAGTFTYIASVFVAGAEFNGGFYEAKYWKNNQPVLLNEKAFCNTIFVKGNDVYAAGTAGNFASGLEGAVVWKNNNSSILPSNSLTYGSVLSVFQSGNDLYAVGTAINPSTGNNVALSWKNSNLPLVLSDATSNIVANSVFVTGSDIWMAGYTFGNTNKVKVWKNGTEVSLEGANEGSAAFSIFVNATGYYVAGYRTENAKVRAGYWKNGVFVALSDNTNNEFATAITLSGSDVYVAGHETTGTGSIAKYWKNGVVTYLSSGNTFSVPKSIVFFDNNLYIAGYESNGSKDVVVYWKNNIKTQLTDGTTQAQASAIAIQ